MNKYLMFKSWILLELFDITNLCTVCPLIILQALLVGASEIKLILFFSFRFVTI